MPTRLIHEELLTSPSLLRCTPRARDHFHRLLLLADDFGCLYADAGALHGRGWGQCSDVSRLEVAGWLDEWARGGMLFLWAQDGRCYGYLTGWHGTKGQHWRAEYKGKAAGGTRAEQRGSKRKTPRPPGWTGAEPVPWIHPPGWTPGTVWMGPAGSPAWHAPSPENLSLFLPGREDETAAPISRPAVAVAVPVLVAVAVPDAPGALTRAAGAPEESEMPAAPSGPSSRGPSTLERLRGAVAQELGLSRGRGGVGIEIGSSRKLGQIIRHANAAVTLRGFDAVVQACAGHGREMIARGDPPETMAAFGWLLHALAAPDAETPAPRNGVHKSAVATPADHSKFTGGERVI